VRNWDFHRAALGIFAAGLLAGCGASQPPIDLPATNAQDAAPSARRDKASYKVLYIFKAKPDGSHPIAGLINVNGTLYGTTRRGGPLRHGEVFGITPDGTEQTVFGFRHAHGSDPAAGLIDVNGTLYGTTAGGGDERRGIVYSLTTDGVERVLRRFLMKGRRGANPVASLVNAGGTLYGTTKYGGAYAGGPDAYHPDGGGTVFSITTTGTHKLLYSFGYGTDGKNPVAALIDVGGTLYGTTYSGGTAGNGIVFAVTTSGAESVLYNFGSGTDGSHPAAGLLDVNGTLYGTTSSGGTHDLGTVFSIGKSGSEKVLYSFGSGTDGSHPYAGLIDVKGTLYGTTRNGGTGACSCGTIFSITTAGTETVLHDFTGSDGAGPVAALLDVAGVLFGTTEYGGPYKRGDCGPGCGVVFALRP
jgi:uncharacterized repeat protein (TIGR03803 family)